MLTDEEIGRLDYDKLAKLIVQRASNEKELLAMMADAFEKIAVWADKEARND